MNYYERHLGDYARDAGHLSLMEHGVYTLLLDRYYTTEQGIPEDQAHRICRARTRDEKAAVDTVLREFFTLQNGVWINGRAEREITKMQAKINAARENGKRGGRPPRTDRAPEQKPSGFPSGSESVTQPKAHQTPDTKHQTPEEEPPTPLRGRASRSPPRPDDVGQQTWTDWLALRKAKRAPVTGTVLDGARAEAAKAGLTLERFLAVWCARGSQGLMADWLKPAERGQPPPEPEWKREQRERMAAFAGPYAAKPRQADSVETIDAPTRLLG